MKATVTLTEDEVKDIIETYLSEKGMRVEKVNLKCTKRYEDRPAGSSFAVFKNAEVSVDI